MSITTASAGPHGHGDDALNAAGNQKICWSPTLVFDDLLSCFLLMRPDFKRRFKAAAANSRGWVARYGWAEVAGIVTSYLGYFGTVKVTHSGIAGAFGAAISENIGYYTCIIWRELRERRCNGEALSLPMLVRTAWALLLEFGVAELLDSFIVRPGSTYLAVGMFGPTSGIVVGKFAADAVFYVLVITIYSRLKAKKPQDEPV
jgi:hypothetical protein